MKNKGNIKLFTAALTAVLLLSACTTNNVNSETTTQASESTSAAPAESIKAEEDIITEEKKPDVAAKIYSMNNASFKADGAVITVSDAFDTLRKANRDNELIYASSGVVFAYSFEGTEAVNGSVCYIFSFGTDAEEKYTAEKRFCVYADAGIGLKTVNIYDAVKDEYVYFFHAPIKVNDTLSVDITVGNGGIDFRNAATEELISEALPIGSGQDYLNVFMEFISYGDYDNDGNNEIFIPYKAGENYVGDYYNYSSESNCFVPDEMLNKLTEGYELNEVPEENNRFSTFISENGTDYVSSVFEAENGSIKLVAVTEQKLDEGSGLISIKEYTVADDGTKTLENESSFDPKTVAQ